MSPISTTDGHCTANQIADALIEGPIRHRTIEGCRFDFLTDACSESLEGSGTQQLRQSTVTCWGDRRLEALSSFLMVRYGQTPAILISLLLSKCVINSWGNLLNYSAGPVSGHFPGASRG